MGIPLLIQACAGSLCYPGISAKTRNCLSGSCPGISDICLRNPQEYSNIEINTAYFAADKKWSDDRLDKFIRFKLFVESSLIDQPSIRDIAKELAVSTDSLNQIVKHYSGLSPKEFLTNRLMLEARRRMQYGEKVSVKELAFELGFNDPGYTK